MNVESMLSACGKEEARRQNVYQCARRGNGINARVCMLQN